MRPQSSQFNGLLRLSPFDGAATILPDLASAWTVSDDGLTYTFALREGVKFHDGAPLTSDDVVATFNRVAFPPEGIVSIRQTDYQAVEGINALDPLTVEFAMKQQTALFIPALATDWAIVTREQSLVDNNMDLKRVRDYPGTGPFRFVDVVTDEKWTAERNPDYFHEGLPYLDGTEIFHAPGQQTVTLFLGGEADYAWGIAPSADASILERGLPLDFAPIPGVFAIWMNTERSPFDDVRVRKALDLVLDRAALQEVTAETSRMTTGRFAIPLTEYALSAEDLLKVPALNPDKTEAIAEAKRLMADAGYANGFGRPLDLVQRDRGREALQAQAIQELLLKHLGVETEISVRHSGVWSEDLRSGEFEMTVGAISIGIADPAAYLPQWYSSTGGQNFSRWKNQEFDDIMANLVKELDKATKDDLVRQALAVLERENPIVEIGYAVQSQSWHPYVHGIPARDQAGSNNLWKFDTVWMDR
jgi:ABC-type transport system substrate-binding protein